MDFLDELERMAANASTAESLAFEDEVSPAQMARWQRLFNYSAYEAAQVIQAQRSDVTRDRISDEHWSLVSQQVEREGHDREAYGHRHQLRRMLQAESYQMDDMFVFRLGGLLDSAEKVMKVAGLDKKPVVVRGLGEQVRASFCCVDAGEEEN
ncbi:MAG: hypothetical protein M1818_002825 [Claussenomyces sp. TS43310]|nr:MAG: hypothetical protein M1818_002825 [Claussenomyces sp. TS43310]